MSAMVQRLEELLVAVHPPSEKGGRDKSKDNGNADEDKDGMEEEVEGEEDEVNDRHHHHHSLDAQHAQATAAVQLLTKEECVILLQRWLISLGACDCSIMLSLRIHHPSSSSLPSSSSSSSVGCCQTATSPGLVYFEPQAHRKQEKSETNDVNRNINLSINKNKNENTDIKNKGNSTNKSNKCLPISYFMHVVDLGPKPPSKILSKAAMEKEIIEVAGRG